MCNTIVYYILYEILSIRHAYRIHLILLAHSYREFSICSYPRDVVSHGPRKASNEFDCDP